MRISFISPKGNTHTGIIVMDMKFIQFTISKRVGNLKETEKFYY